MDFLVTIVVIMIALVEIQGEIFNPGRQFINDPSHGPPPSEQQRYADVILYLTPSQIKALQESQGLISPSQVPQTENYGHYEPQAYPQETGNQQTGYYPTHQDGNVGPHLEYQQINKVPTTQEFQTDPFARFVSSPNYDQPQSIPHNPVQSQKQKRILKPIPFFPNPNEQTSNNEPKAVPESKPQEPAQNTDYDNPDTRQHLKEQWLQILKQNIAHFKILQTLSQNQQKENNTNFHYLSQNEGKFNDENYASEVYKLVRYNNEHQLKKQRAQIQSDVIANALPTLVQEEITKKRTPTQFVEHLPGSVSRPELISIPSFAVKEPQTYNVPLDLFRPIPEPNVNIQTNYVDRPAPAQFETQFPYPSTNNAHDDRQLYPEHGIPLPNSAPNGGNWPIHNHEWYH